MNSIKIHFLGAAETVTGSKFLLTTPEKNILIDCGVFQGPEEILEKNWQRLPIDESSVDMVLLTHGHLDHSGYLPRLVKHGFKGNIYATHATTNLCSIMLLDSAHIQESDAYHTNKRLTEKYEYPELIEPLYTKEDVAPAMQRFISLPYNQWLSIDPEITLVFRDAGHIKCTA